jgi:hypothetical protein
MLSEAIFFSSFCFNWHFLVHSRGEGLTLIRRGASGAPCTLLAHCSFLCSGSTQILSSSPFEIVPRSLLNYFLFPSLKHLTETTSRKRISSGSWFPHGREVWLSWTTHIMEARKQEKGYRKGPGQIKSPKTTHPPRDLLPPAGPRPAFYHLPSGSSIH